MAVTISELGREFTEEIRGLKLTDEARSSFMKKVIRRHFPQKSEDNPLYAEQIRAVAVKVETWLNPLNNLLSDRKSIGQLEAFMVMEAVEMCHARHDETLEDP